MTNNDTYQWGYSNEPAVSPESTYDPFGEEAFEEKDADEIAETIGYIGASDEVLAQTDAPAASPLTATEKIDILFANMKPYRLNFLHILSFCVEPKTFAQLEQLVIELQAQRRAVYTAANYCQMLASAGALLKITQDGTSFDEIQVELVEVERDGQTFIEPGTPPLAFWQTTDAGRRAIESDKPLDTLQRIFAREARYKVVFEQLLEFCSRAGGVSIVEIKQTINKNPVLEYPAKTAQFFMDYLERNGALVWDQTWKTTDLGMQALSVLQTEGEML